ncbi:MAG TPA: HAD-IC family P-type ATPase [Candidatus Udaeobacter sp.]|nr:HAD-IC family P-type ATPase [Candidatus Udaeobacter sp.]
MQKGLTNAEVKERCLRFGLNQLTSKEIRWYHIALSQFKNPFIFLLAAAAGASFVLGEEIDGVFIIIFILTNAILGFWQENHSAHALRDLKKYITEKTHVIREGKEVFIDVIDLVVDDIVMLQAGDKIPADIKFLESRGLLVDESILTGESAPAAKSTEGENNLGFSGTLLVSGNATAIVLATGNNTEIGKIAKLTLETVSDSAFQREMKSFSSFILRLVVISILALFLFKFFTRGAGFNFVEFIIFAIALSVGVIPEALPLVITTALSRGALQLAKKHVVPKRLSAIEDLGNIDILCTDKTGTITENEMKMDDILETKKDGTLRYALLASNYEEKKETGQNSFDTALWDHATHNLQTEVKRIKKIAEMPFDPERRRNSVLVQDGEQGKLVVRGAPEELINLCSEFEDYNKKEILEKIKAYGLEGKRVLAIAFKEIAGSLADLEKIDLKKEENKLTFVGLAVFADPLKSSAMKAIKEAGHLGVQVKIISGDSKEVTGSVAYKIGLISSPEKVITGSELEQMGEEAHQAVLEYHAFARVSPVQKFNIINLLKGKHFVGFLGEGFNDLPALKTASVALVVNNASDIAKDTADIILLNKSLMVIIDGIKEGRRIFVNSFKYIKTTLAGNFGNFYALVFASLLVPFLPMLPLQILLLNFLTDFPMIAIGTDNVDLKELRKPKGFQIKEVVLLCTILGLVSTGFDFAFFGYFYRFGEQNLQTMWFIGSVLTEFLLIFSMRRQGFFLKGARPGKWILGLTVFLVPFSLALPYIRIAREIFSFKVQPLSSMVVGLILVVAYLAVNEIVKLLYYRRFAKR